MSTSWVNLYQQSRYQIRNFIAGDYQPALSAQIDDVIIDKHSPRDGKLLYQLQQGSKADVNLAVSNAREVFERGDWSDLPMAQKRAVIYKLADLIEEHADTLALYESLDVGKPINKALNADMGWAAGYLRYYADMAEHLTAPSASDAGHFAYQQRKPIGVVAGICGWNFPLVLAVFKIAPALMMGNSVILKPSEFTSLSTSLLAELAVKAGLPKGVFNVVHGAGTTVGSALAHHPDVDLMSFVGGTVTGKAIVKASGDSNMKRLILECGGKSPYIVFDDCPSDLEVLADDIVAMAFPNQGALCVAGTRLLIQDSIREQLMPLIVQKAAAITPQDPLDENCEFGAIMNEAHMHKVLRYIDTGKKEGAELVLGGERFYPDDEALKDGFYIEPTIFDNVDPQATIAQEEIFGPVLSVFTFKDEAEAISLANSTCFGLAAYAATENLARAKRLGCKIKAGSLTIRASNQSCQGNVVMASDKHGQSGFGMSGGLEGLAAYSIATTVHVLT